MIYLVLGEQGVGKTKYLVEEANKEKEKGNNNIVFIDADDSQITTLDYKVRLVDAKSYKVANVDGLLGVVGGILARDYIDGIYDIIDINDDNIEEVCNRLKNLSEYSKADIYLGLDWTSKDVPSSLDAETIELKLED